MNIVKSVFYMICLLMIIGEVALASEEVQYVKYVKDGKSDIEEERIDYLISSLDGLSSTNVLNKAREICATKFEIGRMVSLYINKTHDLDVAIEYIREYQEMPLVIDYEIFRCDEGENKYDLEKLAYLYGKKLIIDSTKQYEIYFNKGRSLVLYPKEYLIRLLRLFPDDIVIRRVMVEYERAPYVEMEYSKALLAELMKEDALLREVYEKRKKGAPHTSTFDYKGGKVESIIR